MLSIFDIDGTICDTQEVEGRCYALAIERVTGLSLDTLDWSTYDEPTSSDIVRHLLAGDPTAKEKEDQIKSEFGRLLKEEQPKFPGDFMFRLTRDEAETLSRSRSQSVILKRGRFSLVHGTR